MLVLFCILLAICGNLRVPFPAICGVRVTSVSIFTTVQTICTALALKVTDFTLEIYCLYRLIPSHPCGADRILRYVRYI